ncbi:GspH/FimT family pseudopilin [Herminiimonas aquatilis]|uniref:Type II secretion system protein H n=1 Tax=Herminiimonas aquatilis TaxID=345342 RepID=A0ABW2J4X0_9BURK
MLKRSSGDQGFTLIELMIGIAIMAIVITLGMPSYSTWIQNSRLRNAAESILNGLQLARSEAVARNQRVRFTLGAGSSWVVCLPDPDPDADCVLIQSRATGDGSSAAVTVVANPAITDVDFSPLGQGTAISIDVDVNTAVLSAEDSRNLRILVSGGNVRMCDPNVNAPDSRAC